MPDVKLSKFEGGATRSESEFRYDLIPREALDAIARRLNLGAKRHGENNWKRGGKEFRKACINHLLAHLLAYMEAGNEDDENLDAILCNAAFLAYFEKRMPFRPQDALNPPTRVKRGRNGKPILPGSVAP